MKKQQTRNRAFTLIELLVVVAIIGILTTVVVVNLTTAQKKARDAKRVSDIQEINKAVQLEAMARGSSSYYDSACANTSWTVKEQNFKKILVPAYLPTMPVDPVVRYDTRKDPNHAYNVQYVYYTGVQGLDCAVPTYLATTYYLWTGLDTPNSNLANSSGVPGATTILTNLKGSGAVDSTVWNTSYTDRQDVNNFFVIKIGS
ncbi:MAG: type II secretion system protein [Patescibacteria group bacterium]|jgi:prepilin-type N-terminal cleavage/methylation domain-containing protein